VAFVTNTPQLSDRGRQLVDEAPMKPYIAAHYERIGDRHDPVSNPDGYIGLAVAENKLVWDHLAPKLRAPRDVPHGAVCYDRMTGSHRFREHLARFMGRTFLGREVDPAHVAVLAGAGSVLEILFYVLGDPGDGVLVHTPSYSGFWADLENRDGLAIVPVHTNSSDGFTLTEDLLDAALAGAGRPVKALLYTNPNNPLGTIASRDEIEMVTEWSARNQIHLVVDEIYALSVYGDRPFVSAASLGLGDGVHIVWAFSKDFGSSGLRCGVLVTENEAVMQAVDALAYWSVVSGDTQHLLSGMVADDAWVSEYLTGMRRDLRDSYRQITGALEEQGIPFLPAEAGFFFLCDLRAFLESDTWEAEAALWERILSEANVNLTPGSACHNGEPGFLRMCFATEPPETVVTAVRRMGRVLKGA
jgi:aspartate/methionine/tyrosine aminotransferase